MRVILCISQFQPREVFARLFRGICKLCAAGGVEDGVFALFLRPHPGGFDSSRVPTPGNLPSRAKEMLMPGGQPGGSWALLELTDALCIMSKNNNFQNRYFLFFVLF